MLILPGALPVAPPNDQVHMPVAAVSPVKTVTAPGASGKTRNETGSGNSRTPDQGARIKPPPDPDRPTGPPPTFEANLLEAEREKLRAGPELRQEARSPETFPQPAETYAPAPPPPDTHKVDITV